MEKINIISHRGNLNGRNESLENNPDHIMKVSEKFVVETDIWYDNGWYLGHDNPEYKIKLYSFYDARQRFIFHAKNDKASEKLLGSDFHWFYHDKDRMTLTSRGLIWCHSGVYIKNGIVVELGAPRNIPNHVMGVCTDYVQKWTFQNEEN